MPIKEVSRNGYFGSNKERGQSYPRQPDMRQRMRGKAATDEKARTRKSRQGRPKVARFQPWDAGGKWSEPRRGERNDGTGRARSFVPDGTRFILAPQPSDESLGYFQASLRDVDSRHANQVRPALSARTGVEAKNGRERSSPQEVAHFSSANGIRAPYSENEIKRNARPHPGPLPQEREKHPQCLGIFMLRGAAPPNGDLRQLLLF